MTLTVLHMGKARIPFVRAGIEHFQKKIRPYANLDLIAIREEPLRKGASIDEARRKEKERLKKRMDHRHIWLTLDPKGQGFDSEAFASRVTKWIQEGRSHIGFIVGGPHGVDPEIKEEAEMVVSVSSMTFSHELALLVLLEQLYRFLAVFHGLPYPK